MRATLTLDLTYPERQLNYSAITTSMLDGDDRTHSRLQFIERPRRSRWFPCAALIVVACVQAALAILLIPDGFGSARARRAPRAAVAQAAIPSEAPPRALSRDAQPVATGPSPRRPRIVPALESNVPAALESNVTARELADSQSPEPNTVGSTAIPYAPAPTTSGRHDPSAPPASSAAILAAHPMPAPVPSTLGSDSPTPSPSTSASADWPELRRASSRLVNPG